MQKLPRLFPVLRQVLWNKLPVTWVLRYIRRVKVEAALRSGRSAIVRMPQTGCKMSLQPTSYFAETYIRGDFEPHLVRYLKRNVRPGMICVDAGANVGFFTLLMAKLVGPKGRVFAFEPTPTTYDCLVDNIRLNSLTHVTALQVALADHEGIVDLSEGPPGYEVYNSLGTITHHSAIGQPFLLRAVRCTTLDAYQDTVGLKNIDIIKIDVEGSELQVLKGMEDCFQTNERVSLVIEFADETTRGLGYQAADIGRWLEAKGWKLFIIELDGSLTPTTGDRSWTGQLVAGLRS